MNMEGKKVVDILLALIFNDLNLRQMKAPEKHIQTIIRMAEDYAPKQKTTRHRISGSLLSVWSWNFKIKPLLPAFSALMILIILLSLITWFQSINSQQVTFKVVEYMYWANSPNNIGLGVGSLDDRSKQILLTIPLPVTELLSLYEKPYKKEFSRLLKHISSVIEQPGKVREGEYYLHFFDMINKQINRLYVNEQYISIHMEQRLLKMLQKSGGNELMVRVRLIRSNEGKVMLELGKYQQNE